MSKIKLLITSLVCLFFATGTCFAGTPDWVSVPAKKFPPAKYFTSVGTGYNRDVAELQAVKGIASIFGQNIVSTTSSENRMQQARINGDVATANVSSIEQNVLRQVNQDDVIGVEIKESWLDEKHNVWYVLAILDKEKATELYQSMIQKNNQEISMILDQVNNGLDINTIENYSRLDFASAIAGVTDGYLKRLGVINNDVAKKLVDVNLSQITINKQKFDIATNIPICINIDDDSDGRISKSFADIFSSIGFNTVNGSNERYQIVGSIIFNESENANGSIKYCGYTFDGSFKDTSVGEDLIPISFHGREGSTSYENAKSRVKAKITEKIKSEFNSQFAKYLDSITIK